MSVRLTPEQLEAIQQEGAILKALVQIVGDGYTMRFCTGVSDHEYDGEKYSSRGVNISATGSKSAADTRMTIQIDNRDDYVSGMVKDYGITGAEAIVTLMVIQNTVSPGYTTLASFEYITIAIGTVTKATLKDDVSIEVGPINRGYSKTGLYKCSRMCVYEFKGPLCRYSGAATECNRTLADCTALGNEVRFGGFVWALENGESIMVEGQPIVVQDSQHGGSGDDGGCYMYTMNVIRENGTKEKVQFCLSDPVTGDDPRSSDAQNPWWLNLIDYSVHQPQSEM